MNTHKLATHKKITPCFPDDQEFDNDGNRLHDTFREFWGTTVLTFVTAGAVLSSGALSVKYDLVELTSGRVFAIALANACVRSLHVVFFLCKTSQWLTLRFLFLGFFGMSFFFSFFFFLFLSRSTTPFNPRQQDFWSLRRAKINPQKYTNPFFDEAILTQPPHWRVP